MDLTSQKPYWAVQNGLPANYPALRRDRRCDVVIIGGGITGALCAMRLTEAGLSCIVLDKRDIGTGSTSASTGLLQYELDVPLRELVPRIGAAAAMRSYRVCCMANRRLARLIARHRIDCDFARKPCLFLARHAREISELRAEYALRRKIGIDLDFFDRNAIEKHFPFVRPAALYSREGGQVDPHRLTHGLLAIACRSGAEVYDRTEVSRLETTRRGVEIRTGQGFRVRAHRAVLAMGYESAAWLKADGGSLQSTYAFVSEPMNAISGWHQQCLIWESGTPYLYMRTTSDGRVIVGGEDERFVNPRRRDALIPSKSRTLLKKFGRLFPNLRLDVAYAWAGTFATTRDGLANIGTHPKFPHAYLALGYGGNGITFGVIAAEIIRDALLGRVNRDARLFRFDR